MYKFLFINSLVLAFTWFSLAVSDWTQDVSTGVYQEHILEGLLETTGLMIYIFFAYRFLNRRIHLFKS